MAIQNRYFSFLLFILIFSCKTKHGDTSLDISGNWTIVKSEIDLVYGAMCFPFSVEELPFRFYVNDSMIISEMGFYEHEPRDRFIGNQTMYKIKDDSLLLYNFVGKEWQGLKIHHFGSDSIVLQYQDNSYLVLNRTIPKAQPLNSVSKIVVKASTASLNCLAYEIEFDIDCHAKFSVESHSRVITIRPENCTFFWDYIQQIDFPLDSMDYTQEFIGSHERQYNLVISDRGRTIYINFSDANSPIEFRFLLLHLENILNESNPCRYGPSNPCIFDSL